MILFHVTEIVFGMIAGTRILYNIGLPLLMNQSPECSGQCLGSHWHRWVCPPWFLESPPLRTSQASRSPAGSTPPQPCEVGNSALSTFTNETTEAGGSDSAPAWHHRQFRQTWAEPCRDHSSKASALSTSVPHFSNLHPPEPKAFWGQGCPSSGQELSLG